MAGFDWKAAANAALAHGLGTTPEKMQADRLALQREKLLHDSYMVKGKLENGDIAGAEKLLDRRYIQLRREGEDASDTLDALRKLKSGDVQGVLNDVSMVINYAQEVGMGAGGREASIRSYAPVLGPDGQYRGPTYNPATNEWGAQEIPGLTGPTPQQRADIETSAAVDKVRGQEYERRASELLSQMSERNRTAATNMRMAKEALLFAGDATQGLPGRIKMIASTLLPGETIDVTNEAGLQAVQTQMALNVLQSFKGPTTDFEYAVAQSVPGRYTDAKTANIARLKGIERSAWFQQKELDQLKAWKNSGRDIDYFAFDMDRPVYGVKLPDGSDVTYWDLLETAVEYNLNMEETIQRIKRLGAK